MAARKKDEDAPGQGPVQLRLGFSAPVRPQSLTLTVTGHQVLVTVDDGADDAAAAQLANAGVTVSLSPERGLSFPVRQLMLLRRLPENVTYHGFGAARGLIEMVRRPAVEGTPAELRFDATGELTVVWFDGRADLSEMLEPVMVPAFLAAEIPFVADQPTWDELLRHSRLPVVVGHVNVNLDGFVEIRTARSQRVESSPLPGLFRIDDTHYGMPLPLAAAVDRVPGFVWEDTRPGGDAAPRLLPPLPLAVSGHIARDLPELLDRLATYRSQLVVWPSGLGRRILALAAMEALDAYPLMVATSPHALWVWQRHMDMFGRSASLLGFDADVHLVTYRDAATRPFLGSPTAVIFDDLTDPTNVPAAWLPGLRRFAADPDMLRLACCSSFPTDAEQAVAVLGVLRPTEFRPEVPLPLRYPLHPDRRALEHARSYVMERAPLSEASPMTFRRSEVVTCEPNERQRLEMERILGFYEDPHEILSRLSECVSLGTGAAPSPKVVRAAELVRGALERGASVAVAVRHPGSARLLKGLLRPLPVEVVEAPAACHPTSGQATICRFDTTLSDLSRFDEVVFLDYPFSGSLIEAAVGSAAAADGPSVVTVVHMRNSLDDRLAVVAAGRRERPPYAGAASPFTDDEIDYLLAP